MIKPDITYFRDRSFSLPCFGDMMVGELFRQFYTTDRDNPCLYIKAPDGSAISLRSGAVCNIKPDAPVVRVKVRISFRDEL